MRLSIALLVLFALCSPSMQQYENVEVIYDDQVNFPFELDTDNATAIANTDSPSVYSGNFSLLLQFGPRGIVSFTSNATFETYGLQVWSFWIQGSPVAVFDDVIAFIETEDGRQDFEGQLFSCDPINEQFSQCIFLLSDFEADDVTVLEFSFESTSDSPLEFYLDQMQLAGNGPRVPPTTADPTSSSETPSTSESFITEVESESPTILGLQDTAFFGLLGIIVLLILLCIAITAFTLVRRKKKQFKRQESVQWY